MNAQHFKIIRTRAITFASFFSAAPGWAQSNLTISGSYKALACNGGTSLFERAQGTDKNYEIGNTKMKSLLVNAGGDQAAALQILYTYTPTNPTEFSTYLVDFRDDGQIRNNVRVHFCFRSADGSIHGFDRFLSNFVIKPTPTKDWDFGVISAADFGFVPNNKRSLVKVVISLEQPGNIQLGETRIGFTNKFVFPKNTIDVSEVGPCSNLHNCKDVQPSAD